MALKIERDIKECSFFSWLLAMNSSCGQIIFVSISDMEFLENDGNICTEVYGNTYGCVYATNKLKTGKKIWVPKNFGRRK